MSLIDGLNRNIELSLVAERMASDLPHPEMRDMLLGKVHDMRRKIVSDCMREIAIHSYMNKTMRYPIEAFDENEYARAAQKVGRDD